MNTNALTDCNMSSSRLYHCLLQHQNVICISLESLICRLQNIAARRDRSSQSQLGMCHLHIGVNLILSYPPRACPLCMHLEIREAGASRPRQWTPPLASRLHLRQHLRYSPQPPPEAHTTNATPTSRLGTFLARRADTVQGMSGLGVRRSYRSGATRASHHF